MAQTVFITGLEILKPGHYTDANGTDVAITSADIRELAAAYDPALQDAPAVIGHPKMDDPAYGWMRNLRVEDDVLLCDLDQVDPDFADTLAAGRFKRKSLSFYQPRSRGNPKPGRLYPKHLGLLGARAPAVKGLKPIAFAVDDDAVTIDLAGPGPWVVRSIAAAFSSLRDFLIESQGTEKADAVLPTWTIDTIRDGAAEMETSTPPVPPAFSEEGGQMATPHDLAAREAALAARETDLTARESRVAEKEVSLAAIEAEARRQDDAVFVDGLIKDGRLRPTDRADVLAELAAMEDGAATIALAAGDDGQPVKVSPRQAYRRRLAGTARLVELGEFDAGGDPAIDLASAEDIARAAREWQAEEAKAGRQIGVAAAVAHVTKTRRS